MMLKPVIIWQLNLLQFIIIIYKNTTTFKYCRIDYHSKHSQKTENLFSQAQPSSDISHVKQILQWWPFCIFTVLLTSLDNLREWTWLCLQYYRRYDRLQWRFEMIVRLSNHSWWDILPFQQNNKNLNQFKT